MVPSILTYTVRKYVTAAIITRQKNYVLKNVFLKFNALALLEGEDNPVRFNYPNQVAELLQKSGRNYYHLDMALYKPLTTSIAYSFNCIHAFECEKKSLS